ncbi:MAG: GlxA family transcriptional regulator, partial [Rhizobiaceae bacterium]
FVLLDGKPVRTCCGIQLIADGALSANRSNRDLLIPGGPGVDQVLKNAVLLQAVRQRVESSGDERVIAICSGALILAEAGVLNGKSATTHWARLNDTLRYNDVNWDLDQICIMGQRIFTSAGVATGIDLALSIVKMDCGASTALSVARSLVVQFRRTGGQSQKSLHLAGQFTKEDSLTRLIEKIVSEPQFDWSLNNMADVVGLNIRTLSRRFKQDMQVSPGQFVESVRLDHARGLLMDNYPLKRVAADSGFGDLQLMNRAFKRRFGVSVSEYAQSVDRPQSHASWLRQFESRM